MQMRGQCLVMSDKFECKSGKTQSHVSRPKNLQQERQLSVHKLPEVFAAVGR